MIFTTFKTILWLYFYAITSIPHRLIFILVKNVYDITLTYWDLLTTVFRSLYHGQVAAKMRDVSEAVKILHLVHVYIEKRTEKQQKMKILNICFAVG